MEQNWMAKDAEDAGPEVTSTAISSSFPPRDVSWKPEGPN